jgi:hypothetical protein
MNETLTTALNDLHIQVFSSQVKSERLASQYVKSSQYVSQVSTSRIPSESLSALLELRVGNA